MKIVTFILLVLAMQGNAQPISVVMTRGDQSVAGIKTFTTSVILNNNVCANFGTSSNVCCQWDSANGRFVCDTNTLVLDPINDRIGISTISPAAKLTVVDGAVLFSGTTGGVPATGAGTRFMWIPSSGSLRAGTVSGTEWNTIGSKSVAFGENNQASGANSVAAGGLSNTASGVESTVSGGRSGTASGDNSTVGGGLAGTASGANATASGGSNNSASGANSTIGGGLNNFASGAQSTTAGGGTGNASGANATVGGGSGNTASGTNSTVPGGLGNTASGAGSIAAGDNSVASAQYAAVGGGRLSRAEGQSSFVGGGSSNTATAQNSAVVGGSSNTASGYGSLAVGNRAKATARGSFVWADSQTADFTSSIVDEFRVRAQGGFLVDASSVTFSSAGATALFLADSGNLGVSTGTPSRRLSVAGDLNITGSYRSNDSPGITAACSANQGIDAPNVKGGIIVGGSCAAGGTALLTSTNSWSGQNTYYSTTTFLNSIVSTGTRGGVFVTGAGVRLMWIPELRALRAGEVAGTRWDVANIGSYSVALGSNTQAGGAVSIALGIDSNASNTASSVLGGSGGVASGLGAVVGGGLNNTASQSYTVVVGGNANSASSESGFLGGGDSNALTGGAIIYNVLTGGRSNSVGSQYGAMVGGFTNSIPAAAERAFLGGGANNTASGASSVVGGGASNTASAQNATVVGGSSNTASGHGSLAAGMRAKAAARGSFVWSDSTSGDLQSDTTDQFLVRSQGGFYVRASSHTFVNSDASLTWGQIQDDGLYYPYSRTSAQLDGITPRAAGGLVWNTTISRVCVSTGTAVAAFARVDDTVVACR